MVIWSGWGFVTGILAFLGVVAAALVAPAMPKEYSVPLGLVLAAAANYYFARWVDDPSRGREVIDANTGQRLILRRGASLFFIPVRYWTYIMAAGAVLALVAGLSGHRTVA